MSFDIAGNVVLITGGSRGLGLVMARQLVAERARVAICARDPEELARAKRDLGEVLAIPCDVTQAEQLDRLVNEVTHLLGPIDGLIGSESRRGPSLLTRASDRASLRNNEV